MTTPTIFDLYQLVKRSDHPVTFFELRSAFPYIPTSKIRYRCRMLIKQGWIQHLESSDSYIFVGPR